MLIRKIWKRLLLRSLNQTDRRRQINQLFRIEDPWNLGSEKELARYNASNDLIESTCPRAVSLLEIGSAEGHQTSYLKQISESVQCVEISARAIDRARARNPGCTFHCGTAASFHEPKRNTSFDVGTAFEVLYYPKDPAEILVPLNRMATWCFASSYARYSSLIRPAVESFPHFSEQTFAFGEDRWSIWSWRSPDAED